MKYIRDKQHNHDDEFHEGRSILVLGALVLVILTLSGCASITEGTRQTIAFKTDVPCTATRGDQTATVTPEWPRLELSKGKDPITLDCAGKVHTIESKATAAALTGAFLLDFGVVDMATGAFWAFPNEVDLTKGGAL